VTEKIMAINDTLTLKYDAYHNNSIAAKIITIITPSDIVDMETLNIMVQLDAIFTKHDGFHVYLSESPKLPTSAEYEVKGKDVFFGTKLIELSQTPNADGSSVRFKPNTEYKLLIDAPSQSVVEV
jgi:hypothetical protein